MARAPFNFAHITTDDDAPSPNSITLGPVSADWRLSVITASVAGGVAVCKVAINGTSLPFAAVLSDSAGSFQLGTGNTDRDEAPGIPVKQGEQCVIKLAISVDFPPPGGYILCLSVAGVASNASTLAALKNSVAFSTLSGGTPGDPKRGTVLG